MEFKFVTITGVDHYYGKKPFQIDMIVKLVKDVNNMFDSEAIAVTLPYIGTVGYVANGPKTSFKGTCSAGRLYDDIGESAHAKIMFITHSSVIAVVIPKENIRDDEENDTKEEEEEDDDGMRYEDRFEGYKCCEGHEVR